MPPNGWIFIRAPRPCYACRMAKARGPAIFALMMDLAFDKEEQAELNKWASLMED